MKDRIIHQQDNTHEKLQIFRKKIDIEEKRRLVEVDEGSVKLIPPTGFFLLDFPNSYNQAKILERMMTNFRPRNEIQKGEAYLHKEFLLKLIKPSVKVPEPKRLIQSGLDKVLHLESSNHNCLKRAFGDYKTQKDMHYHVELNPPPTDQDKLVEELVFCENPHKNQYLMADFNKNRSLDLPEILELYKNFGIEESKQCSIINIDSNVDMTSLLTRIDEELTEIMVEKNRYYESLDEQIKRREQLLEEQRANEEAHISKEREMKLVESKQLLEIAEKAKVSILNDPLMHVISESLFGLWNFSSHSFMNQMRKKFVTIRQTREIFCVVLAEYQRSFIQFIERDDEKKKWIYEYQQMYNKFIDENADILEQENVKEEFHQRYDSGLIEGWMT